eukprot:gene24637-10594_t
MLIRPGSPRMYGKNYELPSLRSPPSKDQAPSKGETKRPSLKDQGKEIIKSMENAVKRDKMQQHFLKRKEEEIMKQPARPSRDKIRKEQYRKELHIFYKTQLMKRFLIEEEQDEERKALIVHNR